MPERLDSLVFRMGRGEKPFRGKLKNWRKCFTSDKDYIIVGTFDGHPDFHGEKGHTSKVISFNEETGDVETLNSKYRVVGEKLPDDEAGNYFEQRYQDYLFLLQDLQIRS